MLKRIASRLSLVALVISLSFYTISVHAESNLDKPVVKQESDDLVIDADKIIINKNHSILTGNVIAKYPDAVLNTEELNLHKLDTKAEDNGKDYFLIKGDRYVKIKKTDGTFAYVKSILHNQRDKTSKLDNVQIFPGQFKNVRGFLSSVDENEDGYTASNSIFSLCVTEDEILSHERKNYDDVVVKNPQYDIEDKTSSDILAHEKGSTLSLESKGLSFLKSEKLVSAKQSILRAFGVPIFYIPKFSFHLGDNQGDSGFLLPKLLLVGTKQIGLEIPFYLRLRDDFDIAISRLQYQDVNLGLGNSGTIDGKGPEYQLGDLKRMRTSSTGIRLRHLVSDKYHFASFYNLEALFTDKTILVNNNTKLGQFDNGELQYGTRGFINLYSRIKLSDTTFLNTDWLYTTDRNFMYIYKMDFRQYKINTASLFDITDSHYHSISIVGFQPLMMPLTNAMPANIMPVFRSDIDFDKDKLGGNIYFKNNFSHLSRQLGYDHTRFTTDIGYTLPYNVDDLGVRVEFDTLLRGQYDHFKNNAINQQAVFPGEQAIKDQYLYAFGNYAAMVENPMYLTAHNASNIGRVGQVMNFNKLQVSKELIGVSDLGVTIIEPKLAFRYSPNNNRYGFVPNEDALSLTFNNYNAFSLMQTNGFGTYDTGGSFVYGSDVTHKFKQIDDLFVKFSVANNVRVISNPNEYTVPDVSGFYRTVSDMVGSFNVGTKNVNLNLMYRYDTYRQNMREFNSLLTYNNEYLSVSGGYSVFSQYATIFNRALNMVTWNVTAKLPWDLEATSSGGYNLSNEGTLYSATGSTGLTYVNYSLMHRVNCIRYGIMISENHMTIANMPSMVSYRFVVQFAGL